MMNAARPTALDRDPTIVGEVGVPRSSEKPLAAKRLLLRDDVDGLAILGIIEKREPAYGLVMGQVIGAALVALQLEFMKPIGIGILGPEIFPSQIPSRMESSSVRRLGDIELESLLKNFYRIQLMYTGIVQAVLEISEIKAHGGHKTISLKFPQELLAGLNLGASVSLDGTCLSVVAIDGDIVSFDATAATLEITNFNDRVAGDRINVERSAKFGEEIGGHPMSGHVAGVAVIIDMNVDADRNYIWFSVPEEQRKYIFPKGFLGLNGASLTIAERDAATGALKVNLIPDTLRRTSFPDYRIGDRLNFEIETQTMILVDTLERVIAGSFSQVLPA